MERLNVGGEKRVARLRATCTYARNQRFSKTSTVLATEAKHRERNFNKFICGAVISVIPCGKLGTLRFSLQRKALKLRINFLASTLKVEARKLCEVGLSQGPLRYQSKLTRDSQDEIRFSSLGI